MGRARAGRTLQLPAGPACFPSTRDVAGGAVVGGTALASEVPRSAVGTHLIDERLAGGHVHSSDDGTPNAVV